LSESGGEIFLGDSSAYPPSKAVFRIHDILVRIRIRLFSSVAFKMPTKKLVFRGLENLHKQYPGKSPEYESAGTEGLYFDFGCIPYNGNKHS
jgi:hypothetical protein